MSKPAGEFQIGLERLDAYEFEVQFDKPQYERILLDEPAPLGRDQAPNASRILAAAVGNCLSASLLFCLKKAGVEAGGLRTDVQVQLVRNENNRLRIGSVDVTLHPSVPDGAALAGCLSTFEDFCVVTQSVRAGLEVRVKVEPEPEKG